MALFLVFLLFGLGLGQVIEYAAVPHIHDGTASLSYILQNVHIGSIPGRKDEYILDFALDKTITVASTTEEASSFYRRINETHYSDVFYIANTQFTDETFRLGTSNVIPIGWFMKTWSQFTLCVYTEDTGAVVLSYHKHTLKKCSISSFNHGGHASYPCSDPMTCLFSPTVRFVPGLRHVLVSPSTAGQVEINTMRLPRPNLQDGRQLEMTSTGVVLNITKEKVADDGIVDYGMAIPGMPMTFTWDNQESTLTILVSALTREPTQSPTEYVSIAASVILIVVWFTHVMAMTPIYDDWKKGKVVSRPGIFHVGMEALGVFVAYAIVCNNIWSGGTHMFGWMEYSAPFVSEGWSRVIVVLMFAGVTVATALALGFLGILLQGKHRTRVSIKSHAWFQTRTASTETVLLSAFIVQFVGETKLTYQLLMTAIASLMWIYNRTHDVCAAFAHPAMGLFSSGTIMLHFLLCLPYFILGGVYPVIDLTDQFPTNLVLATATTTFGALAFGATTSVDKKAT